MLPVCLDFIYLFDVTNVYVTSWYLGRVDDLSFFEILKSILFFVNSISLYFFHFLLNITTFCLLLLYFD